MVWRGGGHFLATVEGGRGGKTKSERGSVGVDTNGGGVERIRTTGDVRWLGVICEGLDVRAQKGRFWFRRGGRRKLEIVKCLDETE